MEIEAITRKWGNSIAIIIPSVIVEQERLSENQEVKIIIEKKRPKAGALFGFIKGNNRSAQEIKDSLRKGWLSDSDKKKEKEWKKI